MALSVRKHKTRLLRKNLFVAALISATLFGISLLWIGFGLGETLRRDIRTLNASFTSLLDFLNEYLTIESERAFEKLGPTLQVLKVTLLAGEALEESLQNARRILERNLFQPIVDSDLLIVKPDGQILKATGLFANLLGANLGFNPATGRAVSFVHGTKRLAMFLSEPLDGSFLVAALHLHPDTYEPLFEAFSRSATGIFNHVYVHVDGENALGTTLKRRLVIPNGDSSEVVINKLFEIRYIEKFEALRIGGNVTYLFVDAIADLRNFFMVFTLLVAVFLVAITAFTHYSLERATGPFANDIEKIERAVREMGNTGILPPPGTFEVEEIYDVYTALSSLLQELSASMEELEATNEELEKAYNEISRKSDEFRMLLLHISERLATIAEGYDESTGQHINRVKVLSSFIAEKLGLSNEIVEQLKLFASLHDIGKIFIPKEILLKPGMLTPEEWEIMKKHTVFSKRILDIPGFETAFNIALYHHENYDGSGYPYGLRGEEIPIEAQIVKIVDVYDALRSDRPYKKGFPHDEAVRIILRGDGRTSPEHFSPRIVEVFSRHAQEIGRMWDNLR